LDLPCFRGLDKFRVVVTPKVREVSGLVLPAFLNKNLAVELVGPSVAVSALKQEGAEGGIPRRAHVKQSLS